MNVLYLLTLFMSFSGLESTYTLESGGPGLPYRQHADPVQGRIINANPDASQSVEDKDDSEYGGGSKCEMGQIFYLSEEGRLMRCNTHQFHDENSPQPSHSIDQAPNAAHLVLPGLPSFGLSFWTGVRVPENYHIQNQDITATESGVEFDKKKPIHIESKPVLIKPVHKPKPILVKPVHKPLVHPHPHHTHHKHPHGHFIHATLPMLSVYHQTGVNSGNHERNTDLLERQVGLGNDYSVPYWYFMLPHRQVSISLPSSAENVLRQYGPHPEKIESDNSEEGKRSANLEVVGDISSKHLLVDQNRSRIMTIELPTNSPVDLNIDITKVNITNDGTHELKNVEETHASNARDDYGEETEISFTTKAKVDNAHTQSGKIVEEVTADGGHGELRENENEREADTSYDQNVERNTENAAVEKIEDGEPATEIGAEESLSDGPDVMENANEEPEESHIRRNREAPGIPIDILNDQQSSSSSILDRNTLISIMSSLKEQYLKNAEPDQRKLIEDAFDRLHCSVRDMKKLDERPVGKKIDGHKKATLKLLAERAQPLIDEPDYYSDATDDVSAEPSFLELLNVATKHKGKQPADSE